jgi:hypothetical protein
MELPFEDFRKLNARPQPATSRQGTSILPFSFDQLAHWQIPPPTKAANDAVAISNKKSGKSGGEFRSCLDVRQKRPFRFRGGHNRRDSFLMVASHNNKIKYF